MLKKKKKSWKLFGFGAIGMSPSMICHFSSQIFFSYNDRAWLELFCEIQRNILWQAKKNFPMTAESFLNFIQALLQVWIFRRVLNEFLKVFKSWFRESVPEKSLLEAFVLFGIFIEGLRPFLQSSLVNSRRLIRKIFFADFQCIQKVFKNKKLTPVVVKWRRTLKFPLSFWVMEI